MFFQALRDSLRILRDGNLAVRDEAVISRERDDRAAEVADAHISVLNLGRIELLDMAAEY
jgi:hypothetical protein